MLNNSLVSASVRTSISFPTIEKIIDITGRFFQINNISYHNNEQYYANRQHLIFSLYKEMAAEIT